MGFPAIVDVSPAGGTQPMLRLVFDQARLSGPGPGRAAGQRRRLRAGRMGRVVQAVRRTASWRWSCGKEVPGRRDNFHRSSGGLTDPNMKTAPGRTPGRRLRDSSVQPAYFHSRMSTKWPAIAAAAAMAGDTRCVRPLKPWRPSKLRFEVEAQRSCGFSRSSFMARHIEQPGSRQSKPAAMKILSRPSASRPVPSPGRSPARSWRRRVDATFLPSTTLATARRSSMRPLVQEPMKTRSSAMSVILVPGVRPI